MRKILTSLCILCLAVSLFGACGSSDDPPDAPPVEESSRQEESSEESGEESGGEESPEEEPEEDDEPFIPVEPAVQAAGSGTVTIRVVDGDGNPVEGVHVVKPDGFLVGMETTWRGEVVWENAPAGAHELTLITYYGTQPTVEEQGDTVSATLNPIEVPVSVTLESFPATVEVLWPLANPMDSVLPAEKQVVFRFTDSAGDPVPDLEISMTVRRGVGGGAAIEDALMLRATNGEGKTTWNSPPAGTHTIYAGKGDSGKSYEITVPEGTGATQIDLTW